MLTVAGGVSGTNQKEVMLHEVNTESLAMWTAEYQNQEKWGECLERMPDAMLAEWNEVVDGRAVLKTPDGRVWWVPVSGRMGEEKVVGDTASALIDYVVDHMTAVGHGCSGSFPTIFFERTTLDPTCVFCCECMAFVNVSVEAQVYDEQENRGWDG